MSISCISLVKSSRGSHPEGFLRKGVLKIYSKFTGEHPCRSAISIMLLCNSTEIAFRHGCSPVNFQHIFRTPFPRNTSEWLLLEFLDALIAKTNLLEGNILLKSHLGSCSCLETYQLYRTSSILGFNN